MGTAKLKLEEIRAKRLLQQSSALEQKVQAQAQAQAQAQQQAKHKENTKQAHATNTSDTNNNSTTQQPKAKLRLTSATLDAVHARMTHVQLVCAFHRM